MSETEKPRAISLLTIGTQILTKDVTDQFIRSISEFRTHYAPNAKAAKRILQESPVDLVITEFELTDSSAFHLLKEMKKLSRTYFYVIMLADSGDEKTVAMAQECEVDGVLLKPYNAKDVQTHVDRFAKVLADPESISKLIHRGQRAHMDKLEADAEKFMKRALAKEPENPRCHYRLGTIYLARPDLEKAEQFFLSALRADPNYIPAQAALGLVAFKKGDFETAHTRFSEAQSRSPLHPERPVTLAKLYQSWAMARLQEAALKYSFDPQLQFEIGRLSVMRRDYTRAVQIMRTLNLPKTDARREEADVFTQLACKLGKLK